MLSVQQQEEMLPWCNSGCFNVRRHGMLGLPSSRGICQQDVMMQHDPCMYDGALVEVSGLIVSVPLLTLLLLWYLLQQDEHRQQHAVRHQEQDHHCGSPGEKIRMMLRHMAGRIYQRG